jgi:predicted alpha/beta hydrolase
MHPMTITTEDGYALAAHHFEPSEPCGITVMVSPAVLVRQRFYFGFARWLAERGVRVITYSNRGMGLSLAGEQGAWHHELRHWGERDVPAVIAWARANSPRDKLFLVGHSMGGQVVALSDAVHELDGIITVAATSAYWRHWPRPRRYGILAWYGLAPVIGRIVSTFPTERAGLGPDMRSTLVRDWVRWGRHPDYLFGPFGMRPKMNEYEGRVLAFSFTDDRFGVRAAVDDLHQHYFRARMTRRHVDPSEVGAKQIGHFAWFKEASGHVLWEQTLAWMSQA